MFVTGGSRGIGAGIVRALAARGCWLGIGYRSGLDAAALLADEIAESFGVQAAPIPYDLQDRDAACKALTWMSDTWGSVDSLIVNAGVWRGGLLTATEFDQWWDLVETNLKGSVAAVRSAIPVLAASKSGASVVLVSSVVGLIGHAGDTAYASVKAAMVGFARSLAKEVAGDGIRVNVLAPGFVDTDMTAAIPQRSRDRILAQTVLGRFGEIDEVARAAAFLSEDATYCTGTLLTVDGGWSL